jgi:hypothetical protein
MPTATKKTTTMSRITPTTPAMIQSSGRRPSLEKIEPPPGVPEAGGAAGCRAATGGAVVGTGVAVADGAALAVATGVVAPPPPLGSEHGVPLAASLDTATQKLAEALPLAVVAVIVPQYLRVTSNVQNPVKPPDALVVPFVGGMLTPPPTASVIASFAPKPDAITL